MAETIENLSVVYHLFYDRVASFCQRYRSLPRECAEDHTSEAFMTMCLSNKAIPNIMAALSIWIFTVKQRFITSHSKRQIVCYSQGDLTYELTPVCSVNSDDECRVNSIKELIPHESQNVIDLLLSGYSQHEAAKLLGCSQSTIGNKLRLAKSVIFSQLHREELNLS